MFVDDEEVESRNGLAEAARAAEPPERIRWTVFAGGIDLDSLTAAVEAGKKGDAIMILLTPERVPG